MCIRDRFRIGYIAGGPGSESLIAALAEAGPPFSLSSPAIEAGMRALAVPEDRVAEFIAEVRREVIVLTSQLRAIGCMVSDSQANFVLLKVHDPRGFCAALLEKGILVRSWPGKEGYEQLVRVTVPGDTDEFSRLSSAIQFMEAYV
ncbi:MAG: aminotransferase class I/II-fold pyridoxal phosphate-dependent enzyme, partial [Rectinema sp.]|nr:aminotransferase class I/II-fold pyridoxal phosphate-dependent enzyme [Rectinema sp.]